MENIGALDERPKDECLRLVCEESDVFVGIFERMAMSPLHLRPYIASSLRSPRIVSLFAATPM